MTNPIKGYHLNGNIYYEKYYLNGKRHNENGPAFIFYYPNGNIQSEHYIVNNNYHNENGPACIWYDENGKINYAEYWLNNKKYDKEIYYRVVKLLIFV